MSSKKVWILDKRTTTSWDNSVSTNKDTKQSLLWTIGGIKNLKKDADVFMTNSAILHSELLYNFLKSARNITWDIPFPEDDTNTLFSILEKEHNNLLAYIDYLPLGEVIVLNKFLNKNLDKSIAILRIHKLNTHLIQRIADEKKALCDTQKASKLIEQSLQIFVRKSQLRKKHHK
jgi:hypothetical protein